MPGQGRVVIVDDNGNRHFFPEGFDPKRAAGIVAQNTKPPAPREPGLATIGEQMESKGSSLGRFASNAWEMVNPVTLAKGAYQMVRHPLDTYESMVDQSAEQFGKAREAYDRGGMSEAIGHAAAGVLPMVGPLAANIGEQAASGDYAGAAGATIGLLAGPKIAKEVIKLPTRVPAVRAALERGAAARVADVMTPKASNQIARRMGEKATKIAPQILKENRGGWSRAALQKQILGKLDDAEQGLDAATDARLEARAIDTKPVLDALQQSRDALTAKAVVGSKAIPAIEEAGSGPAVRQTFDTSFDANQRPMGTPAPKPPTVKVGAPIGEDVVPAPNQPRVSQIDQAMGEIRRLGPSSQYEPLRVIRQAYDGPAKTVYNPSLVDDFLKKSGEAKGAADVTAALRDTLAKADPAAAEANARYALYKSAADILEAAEQIEKAKPKMGRLIMARLTATIFGGQAAGPAGAATGFVLAPAVDGLANAGFTTKLKTAQLMQAIADATKAGDVPKLNNGLQRILDAAAKARVPVTAQSRQMERVGQE
jgi:hypothetical protein